MLTYEVIATKPVGAKFFNQVSEENRVKAANYQDLTASYPGFINQEIVDTSENVRTYTVNWDSIENYINWSKERKINPFVVERSAYNQANGITFQYREIIS